METKRTKLTPPDGYELDRENSTLEEIVWKPIKKEITYKDVCKALFSNNKIFYTGSGGTIFSSISCIDNSILNLNNATSELQLKKMLAYNKLMNIAEYLNEGWKPNWDEGTRNKYVIVFDNENRTFSIDVHNYYNTSEVLFKSKELAEQAIKIMSQEDLNILFKS